MLVIAVGVLLIWLDRSGSNYSEHREIRRMLVQAEEKWEENGHTIQWGSTRAKYYGNSPRNSHEEVHALDGVLGLVDNRLIYEPRYTTDRLIIPLHEIQWIGTHVICLKIGNYPTMREAMIIHYVDLLDRVQWRMATFITAKPGPILRALSKLTSLPHHHLGRQRRDFGPIYATRMEQDIYGQWQKRQTKQLYLTPINQLVFGFRDPLPINRLHRIEVITGGRQVTRVIPLNEALLRLEYEDSGGQRHVIGYLLRQADALARVLAERSGAPRITGTARKKK